MMLHLLARYHLRLTEITNLEYVSLQRNALLGGVPPSELRNLRMLRLVMLNDLASTGTIGHHGSVLDDMRCVE